MTRRRFELRAELDKHTVEVEVFLWEEVGGVSVGPQLLASATFIGQQYPEAVDDFRDILRGLTAHL